MILFLVDDIHPSGKVARTSNPDKIDYNIRLLGSDNFKAYNNAIKKALEKGEQYVDAIPCGRFVLIIMKYITKEESGMIFLDFENEPLKAYHMVTGIVNGVSGANATKEEISNLKMKISKAFFILKPFYDENYDFVGLTLDSSKLN